jgi:hypothetical protein
VLMQHMCGRAVRVILQVMSACKIALLYYAAMLLC